MLEILKLPSPNNGLRNNTLRERLESARCGRSQEFLALLNEEEVGILSYEDWSDQSFGFIYLIFVLPSFRQQGVGASLLAKAEHYALQLNCNSVRLKPYALDDVTDQHLLQAWYTSMDYSQTTDNPEHVEKRLRNHDTA